MTFTTAARLGLVLTAAAAAPMVALAPAPEGTGATADDLVREARSSGLEGWELVDRANDLVHGAYDHYSAWHLWESPATSLAHGRGSSVQVNRVLAQVLTALGFEVELVHAARVRFGRHPWWHAGHLWARVTIAGEQRDVCAMTEGNRAGRVAFTPLTEVREVHPWTIPAVTAGLAPFVVVQVWRQLVLGDEVPGWMYRPFGELA
ncbi:hypothetical protein ACSDQ9_06655 [Aestuariimicrobium soli]|uniref:hypothetical protein n=1 Tax=Aestuariimicrobium soli TaxID=2035834 RepID=UPI003EBE2962